MKKEEVSAGLGKEAVRERRKIKIKSFKKINWQFLDLFLQ